MFYCVKIDATKDKNEELRVGDSWHLRTCPTERRMHQMATMHNKFNYNRHDDETTVKQIIN